MECQREYEGKGAHPNFIAQGVIDGFPEVHGAPMGLKQKMSETDLIRGVWCAQKKRALSLSLYIYIYWFALQRSYYMKTRHLSRQARDEYIRGKAQKGSYYCFCA